MTMRETFIHIQFCSEMLGTSYIYTEGDRCSSYISYNTYREEEEEEERYIFLEGLRNVHNKMISTLPSGC